MTGMNRVKATALYTFATVFVRNTVSNPDCPQTHDYSYVQLRDEITGLHTPNPSFELYSFNE